ncbi:MAG: transglutaminase-like domain-containing protein [Fibrobacter sp.]|nr:transglutaminase-like domain-containing protein [Fibrobacter sp.]
MKKEIVDIRYVAKILFLVIASVNLGHTFDVTWLGLLFATYFAVIGYLNGTRRREFSARPKYNKIPAYGAIVPLALYWVVTPGVENGVNPVMVFLPGLYLLFLAALQERSRGNGGFEAFVAFDGVAALLFSMFAVPKGWSPVGFAGLLLALFAYSRRGTAWYKYLLFVLLIILLSGISYGGWLYWRAHRGEYGARMADDYYQRERVLGFDPVNALGSFGSNYQSKYNNQVVLRVWDSIPSKYLKAASYEKYVAGIWKPPVKPLKTLIPSYYQVDYAVLETSDSVTYKARQVWIQSTLKTFGFVFAPYGSVGFAAKDLDSLQYFAGGTIKGLDGNGKRSDWYYFTCDFCSVPKSLLAYTEGDLLVGKSYEPLLDTIVTAMGLVRRDSLDSTQILDSTRSFDSENLQRILSYFKENFTYSLKVPGLGRKFGGKSNVSRDPLSVFWHAKQGYCEYYATLSVLALRRVGIPARYATGFANPEVVEGRPYAIFRRKHSHSWVEAFVDGHWVIFDPTPPMLTSLGNEPNLFAVKWEGLQGRFARAMHFLKEGEWRRTVDSWQNYTQKITDGVAIYVALVIAILAFVGLKIRRYIKGRRRNIITPKNAAAIEWARRLTKAELTLATLGFHREDGETVGAFVKRLLKVNVVDSTSKEKLQQSISVLQDYEEQRWMK